MTGRTSHVRLLLICLLLVGLSARLSGQNVEVGDVRSDDPRDTGNGCDSTSGNGSIPPPLQSKQWVQRVHFRVINPTDSDVRVTLKAWVTRWWKTATVDIEAGGSRNDWIDVPAGCAAYTDPQVRFWVDILSIERKPKQVSKASVDGLNAEAARLEKAVQEGRVSAQAAISALDAAARALGITSSSNWASFRAREADRFSRLEAQRRSDQIYRDQQAQARQAEATRQQDAAQRAQDEQRRNQEEARRKQEEIRQMQDRAAAARDEQRRRGEEFARQQREETERKLQELADRQKASQDALQASQQAAAAAAASPRLSEDERYRGERSELAARAVEEWTRGKTYGKGEAKDVALVDPFAKPGGESPGVRVDPASRIELQSRRGESALREVLLSSVSPDFKPEIVQIEGLPVVQAALEQVEPPSGLKSYRLRLWTLPASAMGGTSGRIRIATSLAEPKEISVPVAVKIEK